MIHKAKTVNACYINQLGKRPK